MKVEAATKVSIIVPNFNHCRFLETRLTSVLRQTYSDREIIILDDASTDESLSIIYKFAELAPMQVIANRVNSGSAFKQWRRGAQIAVGEYIWVAESDDWADPLFLERLVPILDKSPGVGLAYCQSYQVDEQGEVIGDLKWWTDDLDSGHWDHDYVGDGREECRNYLIHKNTVPNASGVLVRRNLFAEACSELPASRLCGDWHTWAYILKRSDLAFVAEPLNYFRFHRDSMRETTALQQQFREVQAVRRFIATDLMLDTQAKSRLANAVYRGWEMSPKGSDLRGQMKWLLEGFSAISHWNRMLAAFYLGRYLMRRAARQVMRAWRTIAKQQGTASNR